MNYLRFAHFRIHFFLIMPRKNLSTNKITKFARTHDFYALDEVYHAENSLILTQIVWACFPTIPNKLYSLVQCFETAIYRFFIDFNVCHKEFQYGELYNYLK